jgi:2-polyprenyl-3-methyl-5-hydroxy-6-metoxy-1,4-benzoquinol methylase
MSIDGYYSHIRHDLIKKIPENACRILEVGCGTGETSEEIKKVLGNQVETVGIEISREAGEIARTKLDHVYIENVEEFNIPETQDNFDCILYGDVLEHLVDPWSVLSKHVDLLSEDGCVIASIPNISYFKVISMLKKNQWTYQDAGIMDRTHLRFFTRPTIIDMFAKANLSAVVADTITGGSSFSRLLSNLFRSQADRFVQQFIIYATKSRK